MSTKNKVIAIACADIHLSHKPPVWRSNEPNWYEAMARPLNELSELQRKYNCPVLCAGDVFDRWDSPAELINFAIKYLPDSISAIPGQHDLPNHNIKELHRSAFASLTLSGKIKNISYVVINSYSQAVFKYIPYGEKLEHYTGLDRDIKIAIVHEYICVKGSDYKGAPKESYIISKGFKSKKYAGYDIIIYGDNHKGFKTHLGKTTIINCGSLMRRDKDQEDYKPKVWLIYDNGKVMPHLLDISKDIHLTADEMKSMPESKDIDMSTFAEELKKLSSSAIDLVTAMKQCFLTNKVKEEVQDIILRAMKK